MIVAVLGVLAALAFVMGLGALALWALKRFAGGGGLRSSRTRVPIEIVQRIALGPKTGMAIVRVGERVMAVSVGEGGIRPLFELDEIDRQRVIATSTVPMSVAPSAEAAASLAGVMPAGIGSMFGKLLSRSLSGAAAADAAMPGIAPVPSASSYFAAASAAAAMSPEPRSMSPHSMASPVKSSRAMSSPDREFSAMLSMSLRSTTRLAVFIGAVVLSGAASSELHAQTPPVVQPPVVQPPAAQPVTQPPAQPVVTPAVDPQVTQPPAAPVAPQVATPPAGTAAPRTARPAAAVQPPRPLGAPALAGQATPRQGNGASVTRGGAGAARPMSDMRFDSAAARAAAMASGNPRANAATTAPIAADDAIMRMMPQMDLKLGDAKEGGLRLNGTVGIVVMMGLLTLLPTLLLMMTGFTRILIVLHFLKQAMGTQGAPPAHLLAGIALLLTGFVMAPTLTQVNREAITPWLDGRITQIEMMQTGAKPLRDFMVRQTRQSDIKTFVEMSRMPQPNTIDDVPLHVLMSAFVASELRTAFQIGFAIYLPFIIIDTVVASVLMSMGMFMLPPAMISLPFKLLLFVLVDGWSLTLQSLVQSFK